MSRRSLGLLVFVALCIASPARQGRAQAVHVRVPMPTRLVQIYSGYERRLAEAINKKNIADIDRLVDQDFELWSVNNMNESTIRADWIAQSLKEPPASISIGPMDVYDYGSIRIVSFQMKRTVGSHNGLKLSVIDVWKNVGKNSVLKLRYAAIQTAHSQLVPGEVRQQQIKKRY